MSDDIARLSVVCPKCGATNDVLGTDVTDDTPVDCSQCHARIGLWGELKRRAETGARR